MKTLKRQHIYNIFSLLPYLRTLRAVSLSGQHHSLRVTILIRFVLLFVATPRCVEDRKQNYWMDGWMGVLKCPPHGC
jgi:hypothetical protein